MFAKFESDQISITNYQDILSEIEKIKSKSIVPTRCYQLGQLLLLSAIYHRIQNDDVKFNSGYHESLYFICLGMHLSKTKQLAIRTRRNLSQLEHSLEISFPQSPISPISIIQSVVDIGLIMKFDDEKIRLGYIETGNPFIIEAEETNPLISDNRQDVFIMAGGTNEAAKKIVTNIGPYVENAFADRSVIIISGSTNYGVAKLAGDLGYQNSGIDAIGYHPGRLDDPNIEYHPHYEYTQGTKSNWFTIIEPIAYWIDLCISGRHKNKIKLVGIEGGAISRFEYILAISNTCHVGLIKNSGRSASEILESQIWFKNSNLVALDTSVQEITNFIVQQGD